MLERITKLVNKALGVSETVSEYADKGKKTVTQVTQTGKEIVGNVKAAYQEVATGVQKAGEHLQNIKSNSSDAIDQIKTIVSKNNKDDNEEKNIQLEETGEDPHT